MSAKQLIIVTLDYDVYLAIKRLSQATGVSGSKIASDLLRTGLTIAASETPHDFLLRTQQDSIIVSKPKAS